MSLTIRLTGEDFDVSLNISTPEDFEIIEGLLMKARRGILPSSPSPRLDQTTEPIPSMRDPTGDELVGKTVKLKKFPATSTGVTLSLQLGDEGLVISYDSTYSLYRVSFPPHGHTFLSREHFTLSGMME